MPVEYSDGHRRAVTALDRLVVLLGSTTMSAHEGLHALGAVAVGVRRSLEALDERVRAPGS